MTQTTEQASLLHFLSFFLGPVYMEMGDPRWGEVTRLAVVEK